MTAVEWFGAALLVWLGKGALVLGAGLVVSIALRHRSAALVSGVLSATLVGALVLPMVDTFVPAYISVSIPKSFAAAPADAAADRGTATIGVGPVPGEAAAVSVDRAVAGDWDRRSGAVSLLVSLWLFGALILIATYLRSLGRLARLAREARPAEDEVFGSLPSLERATVRVTSIGDDVIVFGPFRPVVLLPEQVREWPQARLAAALAHEAAHIRRRDPLLDLLARLALAIHWINPIAWLVHRRLLHVRELACDAAVVHGGVPAAEYASYLIASARGRGGSRTLAGAALGEHPVTARVLAILALQETGAGGLSRSLRAGFVTGAALIVGLVTASGLGPSEQNRLIQDLSAVDPRMRWEAAARMGNLRSTDFVESLTTALEDPHHRVREYAAAALGNVGSPRAATALLELLDDPNEDVRERAAGALGALAEPGDRGVVSGLRRAVQDTVDDVRRVAAGSLGRIGGESALDDLVRLREDDPNEHVRAVVDEWLRRIESGR